MISSIFERLNPFKRIQDPPSPFAGNSLPGLTGKLEKIQFIRDKFDRAVDFDADGRDRENENWKLFSGFDYGQWDKEAVNDLLAEGRHVGQYNLIRKKVEGLAGSLVKNWFDVDFVPVDGKYSDMTSVLKDLMYSDKEMLDWNSSYLHSVIDGIIYRGIEEMYISDRYSPLGNLGFRRVMPGHVVIDPNWTSHDGWEMRELFKVAFLTPDDIKRIYKSTGADLDEFVKVFKTTVPDFDNGDTTQSYPHFDLEAPMQNSKFRVIEWHHLECEKKEVEVVLSTGDVMPEGDDNYKKEWATINHVDMSQGTYKHKTDVDVYYVTTICPELLSSGILEDRKSEIQIGRLPFFTWSYARINGKDSGLPELLKDVQQTINKRESMIDHMIAGSANGGFMIDPLIVGDDEYKKQQMVENWNHGTMKMFTESGALSRGSNYILPLPKPNFPQTEINEVNRMVDYVDRISQQTGAMEGRSSGSEDSGIFFARRQLQTEIANTTVAKALEHYWSEKGEAYMLMAQQLYSHVYREFLNPASGKVTPINLSIETEEGEMKINDISLLPRHKVVISQSPEGVTQRAVDRAINVELIRVLPSENPVTRAQITANIMATLDSKSQDRTEMEQAAQIEKEFAVENMKTQILGLKMQQMQLAAQMQGGGQPPIGAEGAQDQGSGGMEPIEQGLPTNGVDGSTEARMAAEGAAPAMSPEQQ
jgi:hypothetical protein